jgi:hypothetical protein
MKQRLCRVGGGDEALLDDHTEEVIEIPLLLQGSQMTALETAAHSRGLTAGEMVRDLLRDFLARVSDDTAKCAQPRF